MKVEKQVRRDKSETARQYVLRRIGEVMRDYAEVPPSEETDRFLKQGNIDLDILGIRSGGCSGPCRRDG